MVCHFCEDYGPSDKTLKAIRQLEKGEKVEQFKSPEAFWDSFYQEENEVKKTDPLANLEPFR